MKTHSSPHILKLYEEGDSEILGEENGIVCTYVKCGKTYKEPIIVTNLSSNAQEKTYYACPHCLSKVNMPKKETQKPKDTAKETEEDTEKEEDSSPTCPYHFGYLKTKPKNASIPDECLTCPKMIKCLL
ncbi:MAG: hypothetical protein QXN63_03835 [Candidatus Bathyarchaeia archaeon]